MGFPLHRVSAPSAYSRVSILRALQPPKLVASTGGEGKSSGGRFYLQSPGWRCCAGTRLKKSEDDTPGS